MCVFVQIRESQHKVRKHTKQEETWFKEKSKTNIQKMSLKKPFTQRNNLKVMKMLHKLMKMIHKENSIVNKETEHVKKPIRQLKLGGTEEDNNLPKNC